LAVDFISKLDAKICGSNLGSKIRGSEVSATSAPPRMSARHLSAKICGTETCYLGAMDSSADP
jgi:hypothetical protein